MRLDPDQAATGGVRASGSSWGVSADYYLRLEQGRDRNPSAQVLEALARVFRLDVTAAAYLTTLASPPASRRRARRETEPASIRMLLDSLLMLAFMENRMLDTLAANRAALPLFPGMAPGASRLRALFLDDNERDLFADWGEATAGMVAGFRASIGSDTDDPRVARLIGELSVASERFRQLWALHDVKPLAGAPVRLMHPVFGELHLRREKLGLADTDGQILGIHHAEPGSPSAEALTLLGTLSPAGR